MSCLPPTVALCEAAVTVNFGGFVSYGLKIYPASVTGYFSYRADILVLGAMLGDAAAIGLYTFAVSLAASRPEPCFFAKWPVPSSS